MSKKRNTNNSEQIFYSTTQTHFFKAYGQQAEFISKVSEVMSCLERRKINKVVEEVKTSNRAFRKYLSDKRIVHLKVDDIAWFEEVYEKIEKHEKGLIQSESSSFSQKEQQQKANFMRKENKDKRKNISTLGLYTAEVLKSPSDKSSSGMNATNLSLISGSGFSNGKNSNSKISISKLFTHKQMIKKGFMTFLEKIQNLKKQEFTTETKYLEGILLRECQKLKQSGNQFAVSQKERPRNNVIEELEEEEKINGLYCMIMNNAREETLAVESVEKKLSASMRHQVTHYSFPHDYEASVTSL